MEQSGITLQDVLSILRRRWLLVFPPVILSTALGLAVATILPPVYVSTARILVETQTIPEELARSTVTSGATERVRLIEQRLMTRDTLLGIAARFAVFEGRGDLSPTDIVDLMQEATTIETVALATKGRGEVTASAITISFASDSAQKSARVANEFLSLVLQQNLEQRNSRASDTLSFFSSEAERLGRELGQVEAQITAFKSGNEAALPESLEFRLSEAADLQDRMFEREGRRTLLEEELRVRRGLLASGGGASGAGGGLSPEQQELARLRQEYDQQRAIYAPSHPAVRQLAARIAAVERALASGPAQARSAPGGFDPLAETRRQIDAIELQLRLLSGQIDKDAERLAALRASIERTPEVEVALGALLRQQDNLRAQHQQAVLKQADAATGERLEVNQQAERFEVIEQPEAPAKPDAPNRPLIIAGGFAAGLGLGAALMALAEMLNPYLRTARDLDRQLDMRPFATIPYVQTARERWRRMLRRRATAFGALVMAPAALWSVDRFYLPLPLLAERIGGATGIDRFMSLVAERIGG
jgi:uncharacterized protein involved in exopolysaccharide biosynthesis